MIWLVGVAVYVVAALCAARLIAGHLAWVFAARDGRRWPHRVGWPPDSEQWFGAWCIALALGILWPLAVGPWLVGRRVAVGAERDARLAARESRIKQLERELEIK